MGDGSVGRGRGSVGAEWLGAREGLDGVIRNLGKVEERNLKERNAAILRFYQARNAPAIAAANSRNAPVYNTVRKAAIAFWKTCSRPPAEADR